jgi:hypothetical protein
MGVRRGGLVPPDGELCHRGPSPREDRDMKKTIAGYVGTIGGALLGFLTLATAGDSTVNHIVTAVLVVMTVCMLGVGWYGLRVDAEVDAGAPRDAS